MPRSDYNSSLALSLSLLTPALRCVGSVINDIDTALDSWLHRAGCWTTYWDNTHIHTHKYTQKHTNSLRRGMTQNVTWGCSIKSLFQGQVLVNAFQKLPSGRGQDRARCSVSLDITESPAVNSSSCTKPGTTAINYFSNIFTILTIRNMPTDKWIILRNEGTINNCFFQCQYQGNLN